MSPPAAQFPWAGITATGVSSHGCHLHLGPVVTKQLLTCWTRNLKPEEVAGSPICLLPMGHLAQGSTENHFLLFICPAFLSLPLELHSALAVTQDPWVLFILLKRCSQEAGLCLRGLLFHVKSPGSSWNIDSCYCRNLEDDTDFFFTPILEAALTRKPSWQTPVTTLPVGPQLGTRLQMEQGFRCLFASNRDKHQLACNPERHLLEGCGAEHRQMAS